MKFDVDKWQLGPSKEALADPAVQALRNAESVERIQALAFQLKLCLDIKSLLDLWDENSLPAWRSITGQAGGLIQRSLVKELVLLTTHLVDDRKDSSSVASFHKHCVTPFLAAGPFRSFYQPLFAEIVQRGRELKELRDEIIAHTNWHKLKARLYGAGSNKWGDVNVSRLSELLTMLTWYVQLVHAALGIRAGKFEREIAGAKSLRDAVVAGYARLGEQQ